MKNKYYVSTLSLLACVALVGCAGTGMNSQNAQYEMPAVEYVEQLNVDSAPHQDSFLNQLAMNYRSYAIYNARTSNYPDVAELFAQKAIGAFSGETPFPESLENWRVDDDSERFEIYTAYNDLVDQLKGDAAQSQPQLAAEAQAKFDCWISAAASGQNATAQECRNRFVATLQALKDCAEGKVVGPTRVKSENLTPKVAEEKYYPETRRLNAMAGTSRSRDGVVIVNNVNIPGNLIQPAPVPQQPMIFNQNIYGGDESLGGGEEFDADYVSRDEFIEMMMAMREELAAINARLDGMDKPAPVSNEKTIKSIAILNILFFQMVFIDSSRFKSNAPDIQKKSGTATLQQMDGIIYTQNLQESQGYSIYNIKP